MLEQLVEQIETRFADLERQMSDPEVIGDRERYAEVGREYRGLEPAYRLALEWRHTKSDAEGAREMLAEEEDAETRDELRRAEARLAELGEESRLALIERDTYDEEEAL